MTICIFCGKVKDGASSCIESRFIIDGQYYFPIPFRIPFDPQNNQTRCSDCNVLPGGYHHMGCTMEICPKCGYHWVFCRCNGKKVKLDISRNNRPKVIPFPKKFIRKL